MQQLEATAVLLVLADGGSQSVAHTTGIELDLMEWQWRILPSDGG